MTHNWAYTVFGALHKDDIWDWFGPADNGSQQLSRKAYTALRDSLWGADQSKLDSGCNIIGFDGKKWLVGRVALPSSALDAAKYPADKYACDRVGRPIHVLHGYISDTAEVPARIPKINTKQFGELHERNMIPLWNKSLAAGEAGAFAHESNYRTITDFQPASAEVGIFEHLPVEAVSELQAAHREKKPIALSYDTDSKKWSRITSFETQMEREAKSAAATARKHTGSEIRERVLAGKPASMPIGPKSADASNSGWLAKFKKMSLGGKLAVIGGTVAIGAVVGIWTFKHIQSRNKSNEQAVG
jgi:hypothetical protein